MNRWLRLVRVFLVDLARRKAVWAVLAVFAVTFYFSIEVADSFNQALGRGVSYEIASRQAVQGLQSIAGQLRAMLLLFAALLGGITAPESRRNGTVQFLLSCGAGRYTVAGAQFGALAVLLLAGAAGTHLLWIALAIHYGLTVDALQVAAGWFWLFVPMLLVAAPVFALALTRSAAAAWITLAVVMWFAMFIPHPVHKFLESYLPPLDALLSNVALFSLDGVLDAVTWPAFAPPAARFADSFAPWIWHWAGLAAAAAGWTTLGLWSYHNHDFGSRTAVK